jgi:hypothetical protein
MENEVVAMFLSSNSVPTDGKEMVVRLCDGETSMKVKGVR